MLVKKNVCVKILCPANIRATKGGNGKELFFQAY